MSEGSGNRPMPVLMRSSLLSEPEGPFAQHDGQLIVPAVDENGNQWVSLRVGNGSGSGVTTTLEAGFDQLDSQPNFSQVGIDANGLAVVNHPFLLNFDSTGALPDVWDRARVASGNTMMDISSAGAALVARPGEIGHNHLPAAGVKATITVAPPGNNSFQITGVSFGFNAIAAEAGTFIVSLFLAPAQQVHQWRIGPFAAGQSFHLEVDDLNVTGDLAVNVTLEFNAAPAAGNFEWVNIRGYFAPVRV